ncbi:oxygen-insensitive NAD(P)H-dependent nitroreductase NfsB [Thiomicrospira microaerophila]|uniref:oxygen-insensitive NAD(P)H-dependent nitroreductase NfsB n=1 Tax=Thiomicrospira microaerophila TaxID=406020 RepID=UPI0005C84903|nr:oxygen-insensitive NAD(P)H-dependent nitroreductase NfsB [Thiomicrospira microaerophila]
MNIINIAQTRYSTKKFDPARSLSADQLADIKALLRLSPSSVNSQPWHFVISTNPTGKARIAKAAGGQYVANESKINDASCVVVFCVKTDLTDDYLEALLDQEQQDGRIDSEEMKGKVRKVRGFYADLHRVQWLDTQCWMEKQVYLNMGAFLLGVGALGLDAVPIEGVDTKVLDTEFDLTAKGFKALAVVAIGYQADNDFNAKLPKSRWPESSLFCEV